MKDGIVIKGETTRSVLRSRISFIVVEWIHAQTNDICLGFGVSSGKTCGKRHCKNDKESNKGRFIIGKQKTLNFVSTKIWRLCLFDGVCRKTPESRSVLGYIERGLKVLVRGQIGSIADRINGGRRRFHGKLKQKWNAQEDEKWGANMKIRPQDCSKVP